MLKNKKSIIKIIFCLALFFMGAGVGLSVNVFMTRGVPVIHGGGELLLLFVIPASVFVGYYIGRNGKGRRDNETAKHTD